MIVKTEFLEEKECYIALNDEYKIAILYKDDSYSFAIIPIEASLFPNKDSYSTITCNFEGLLQLFENISSQIDKFKEMHKVHDNTNQEN